MSKLIEAARLGPLAWVQRLGYLLEVTERGEIAEPLTEYVRSHASVVAPLVRRRPITGAPRLERWKLAINAPVEPDL